ncbi:hypothetical protein LCGC14_0452040 [marine sediment metagenome]|uniref:Uncharacterized protein n=1 Tax=marine sediment metagenome TaxID=412755 RepID=A0A0F9VRF5_9ZZZZ
MHDIKYPGCDNIWLWELMPQKVYEQYGAKCIWFIDPKIPPLAQFIRDWFNKPIVLNTWKNSGESEYRGYRPRDCEVGAEHSQHRFGRAVDFIIPGKWPQEIIREIQIYYKQFNDVGLTTIEKDTPTWVHIDVRRTLNPTKLFEVPFQ